MDIKKIDKSLKNLIFNNLSNKKTFQNVFIQNSDDEDVKMKNNLTSVFTENIIDYDHMLQFVNYTYNLLYHDLNMKIDQLLLFNNYKSLNEQEYVFLLYKGGNCMNEYFRQSFTNISSDDTQFTENLKNIENAFNISDVDFCLQIVAFSEKRYQEIYECSIKILYESFINIRDTFEQLFNNNLTSSNQLILFSHVQNPFCNKIVKYLLNLTKRIFHSNEREKMKYIFLETIKNYHDIFDVIYDSTVDDFLNLIKYTLFLKNSIGIINKFFNRDFSQVYRKTIQDLYIKAKKRITELLDIQYQIILSSEFYSYGKINNVLNKIQSSLSIKNINIFKRNDIFINYENDNKIIYTSNKDPLYYHYITFNNTIINKFSKDNYVDFDLLRIKTGYEYVNSNNQKKISSSEFLDLSIKKFNDYLFDNHEHNKCLIEFDNKLICESYDIQYIINDISDILFNISFIPWNDKKYEKRLIRYFFFVGLNTLTTQNNRLMLQISKLLRYTQQKLTDNSYFFDTTYYWNDTYFDINKKFINLIDVNEDYHSIKLFINFIAIINKFYHNDIELIKIINKYRNDYMLDNITDVSDFKIQYAKFIDSSLSLSLTMLIYFSKVK